MMRYELTEAFIWYGARRIPMGTTYMDLPADVSGPDDLSADALAEQFNLHVYRRGNLDSWEVKITHRTPDDAARLTEVFEADGLELKSPIRPQIYVSGNGVSLRYTPKGENDV